MAALRESETKKKSGEFLKDEKKTTKQKE